MIKIVPWKYNKVCSERDVYKLTYSQKRFYNNLKRRFGKGEFVDVGDNSAYILLLFYDLIHTHEAKKEYTRLKQKLSLLGEYYSFIKHIALSKVRSIEVYEIERTLKDSLQELSKEQKSIRKWVKRGQTITEQGFVLTRGSFYVGDCFMLPKYLQGANTSPSNHEFSERPYIYGTVLIPGLPYSEGDIDHTLFCTYKDMSPVWRYHYILWLAGKTSISEIPKEILLFYIFGICIRLFVDAAPQREEKEGLVNILLDLRKEYVDATGAPDESILSFINKAIAAAITIYFNTAPHVFVDKTEMCSMSYYTHFMLYKEIIESKLATINADAAFDIVNKVFQFAPKRYVKELKELYIQRFQEIYSKPIRIQFGWRTAVTFALDGFRDYTLCFSPEHVQSYCVPVYNLPTKDLTLFCNLSDTRLSFEKDLETYNRMVSDYGNTETLLAVFALPDYIDINQNPSIINLSYFLDIRIADCGYIVLRVMDLLKLLGCNPLDDKLPKRASKIIINGLGRIGYTIIFNDGSKSNKLNIRKTCIIYKGDDTIVNTLNKVNTTAEPISVEGVKLIVPESTETLSTESEFNEGFGVIDDKNRFGTILFTILDNRIYFFGKDVCSCIGYTDPKKPISQYCPNARMISYPAISSTGKTTKRTGRFINIVNIERLLTAYGHYVKSQRDNNLEMRFNDFCDWIRKEHERLCAVHHIDASSYHEDELEERLVTIEKKKDAIIYKIDKADIKPERPHIRVTFDTEKLSQLEQQTQEAQAMLSEVFDDNEPTTPAGTVQDTNPAIEILRILFEKEVWSCDEIETLCRERNLMVGSVLEQINDYSYEKVDDAVIEDDGDQIYVTLEYKEQLL